MKNLKQYIEEKLIINKDYNINIYEYHPKTPEELRHIIEDRYEELGTGTEQEPIDFNDVDVSEITTFYNFGYNSGGMFEYSKFEYIDISKWNVSNVEEMSRMFYKCKNLKSVGDLSKWNVSNVENMCSMFDSCFKLESIGDLSYWNVSSVENMTDMFLGCINLKSIGDVSNWNVSRVKTKRYMFYNSGITNIPSWYKG